MLSGVVSPNQLVLESRSDLPIRQISEKVVAALTSNEQILSISLMLILRDWKIKRAIMTGFRLMLLNGISILTAIATTSD